MSITCCPKDMKRQMMKQIKGHILCSLKEVKKGFLEQLTLKVLCEGFHRTNRAENMVPKGRDRNWMSI